MERFARSVIVDGLDVDSLLVITYTDRAAGELRARIRSRLLELDRPDLARDLDGAWISTIHGFCRRLLTAYPLAAGIDPRFRVLDESQARVLQGEAFNAALESFCAADEPERWQLLATYKAAGLRKMLVSVYDTLRSAGLELTLVPAVRESLDDAIAELRAEIDALLQDEKATEPQKDAAADALDLLQTTSLPERLIELPSTTVRGVRAAAFSDARKNVHAIALEELASRDRELLQELLTGFAEAYAEAKNRESALDFEDLQLRAVELIGANQSIRELEQLRFRSIMVDEFQDTNKLQTELIDLLCAGPAKELFFVGDEFQSIYGFRHADVAVFRDRREAAPHVLPLTLNYRSRPEVLAAVNELFDDEFGESFQELTPAGATATRSSGHPSSCSSRTRRPTRTRVSTGAAPRRSTSRGASASSSTPASPRPVRSCSSSPPGRTPSGSRRSYGSSTCRRSGDRPPLLRPAAGRRPPLVPAAAPEPLRRRGAADGARVAVRRRLEPRARPHPARAEKRPIFKGSEDAARTSPRTTRARAAFLQRYERLVESSSASPGAAL